MGQIDSALICYQKSALLIEKDPKREHVLNQGFIRAWIGELFVAREQFRLAAVFFRAAYLKWEQVAPPRASKVMQLAEQIKNRLADAVQIDDRDIERICLDWILGRSVDAQFR
ncbi:MAG: hypothetical protein A3H28_00440 [Acidobacteria bacterium RIFCSPLOWO2_02_FULL_61_28]|nr:MAG: hypothetical protein A3H28_00440 [Acidobacteria bacterium RIFCSPLOWO2_02_FULL_61_28]